MILTDHRISKHFHRVVDKHIVYEGDCWMWKGGFDRYGYGRCTFLGKAWEAHRLIYSHLVHYLSYLDALEKYDCDKRDCVYPFHWVITTKRAIALKNLEGR